jgi:membrane protease YdiL (CAAX protease family)
MMSVFRGEDMKLHSHWKIIRVVILAVTLSIVLALLGSVTNLSWVSNGAVHAGMILAVLLELLWERRSLGYIGLVKKDSWAKDLLFGLGWGSLSVAVVVCGMLWVTSEVDPTVFFVRFDLESLAKRLMFYALLAFGEEMLFRGYVISALNEHRRASQSIGIAAVLFTAIHIINPDYYWFAFIYAFLMAILLGIVFVLRGSLWNVLGFHFAWDFLQSDVAFNLPDRGGEVIFSIVIVINLVVAAYLFLRAKDLRLNGT